MYYSALFPLFKIQLGNPRMFYDHFHGFQRLTFFFFVAEYNLNYSLLSPYSSVIKIMGTPNVPQNKTMVF